ncbi:cytochrome c-550 PedF [Sphingomonas crocodyli]|uniref:Cytochrome c-550 PedF n=1 Tax=Sphingomonas crocodyli TaxID=1979270 RepID=A0A437M5P8_9SPHN|nr:cytochrome c-550 PedF [Sphingomonas crocodyli]RVT93028.1 cytochrome c-550 PedF [Sphingomonas crocodyli]
MSPKFRRTTLILSGLVCVASVSSSLFAHGNMTPQPVDTHTLPDIGDEWRKVNPYRDNAEAAKIGESAYGQNCARCHGLEAMSGGIAPDLRYLETGDSGDEWFINRFQHGSAHDGKVYMPPFGDVLGQKAGWAIRTWLDTKHEE